MLALVMTLFLNARADDLMWVEPVANVDLAQGVCADPAMTDEERAEMVRRSVADAVRCMGEEWAFGDADRVQTSAVGRLTIRANVGRNKIHMVDRNGNDQFYLTSPGLPGTPTLAWAGYGPFRVEGPNYVVQDQDKDYVGAPMPWATFYHLGYAFHGTDQESKLGRPASHGCLRMFTVDARTLNQQVRLANDRSVYIEVYNVPAAVKTKPKIKPKRRVVPQEREYDPYAQPAPYYQPYQPRPFFDPWF